MTEIKKLSREQAEAQGRTLAMFLAGYGFGFVKRLFELLPAEVAAKHADDLRYFGEHVDKLLELNKRAEVSDEE
jgi:hypothetical protein